MSKQRIPPRPLARHGQLRSPRAFAQLLKLSAVSVAVCVVAAVGVAGYVAYDLSSSFTADEFTLDDETALPPDIGEIEGGVNLLLVGSDECEPEWGAVFGDRCSDPDVEGARNDVTILVHISNNPRRITVISFPRDLMIPIPSCTDETTGATISAMSKQMLNSTLQYGVSCVARTVEQLSTLGTDTEPQDVDMAAKVTWGGVINITDAIGGVDVCVENGIDDPEAGLFLPAGTSTIQGQQALAFLRTRHGVGDGGDLARISNQQQYFSALARKITADDVLSDLPTIYRLATTAAQNITPSANLANPLTLVQVALAAKSVPLDQVVFIQYPTVTDPDDANRVAPNESAAAALWQALADNTVLELTGQPSQGNGVDVVPPSDEPGTSDPAMTPTGAATGNLDEATSTLPSSVAGITADQPTCSNGNG